MLGKLERVSQQPLCPQHGVPTAGGQENAKGFAEVLGALKATRASYGTAPHCSVGFQLFKGKGWGK
jgi:hypothetical protein